MIKSKQKYLKRPVNFAYPNKDGKTEILSFNLIVEEQDAVKFDKFFDYLSNAIEYAGGKTFESSHRND